MEKKEALEILLAVSTCCSTMSLWCFDYCPRFESMDDGINVKCDKPTNEEICEAIVIISKEIDKMKEMERPSWDEYFMNLADLVATRSTCLRRSVGAVLVKDKRIIATGYNGSPAGLLHCGERSGCMREEMNIPSGQRHELCIAVHAEQNAIVQAAALGIPIGGATLYCTTQPCIICTKLLINAGIKRIVISHPYPDELAEQLLKEAGIVVEVFEKQ